MCLAVQVIWPTLFLVSGLEGSVECRCLKLGRCPSCHQSTVATHVTDKPQGQTYHVSAGQEFWLAFWNKGLPLKSSAQRAQDYWGQHGTACPLLWCQMKKGQVKKLYCHSVATWGTRHLLVQGQNDAKLHRQRSISTVALGVKTRCCWLNDFCSTRSIWSQANYTGLLTQGKLSIN